MPQRSADYLVAGAGPAGLTVARLLALRGRRVVIVDPGLKNGARLELLAPAALDTVAALGLMNLLDDSAIARPCLGICRRWGVDEPEYEDFFRHARRSGYVVDRARFDAALRASAVAAGAEFVSGRVADIEPDGGIRLAIDDGVAETTILAGTLIDASGRAAVIARRKGARFSIRERMIAELTEETFASGADTPAWLDVEKDDEHSWSYRIRGVDGREQSWRIRPAGSGTTPDAIRRVDASASMLSEMAGDGWIAIGDAASAFDPIASQGLFNALSSALVAAGALLSAGGLNTTSAKFYSDAVTAAFLWSEAGRSGVYNAATAAAV